MEIPTPQPQKPIYIDVGKAFFLNQSRWKMYQDCDRLYAWNQVEGIEPDRSRKVLEIGHATHIAMVLAHTDGDVNKAFTKERFDEATAIAEAEFRHTMAGPQLPNDEADILEGVSTIKRMLPAYFRHWRERGQIWKPLGQEMQFCVEVGEGTNVFLVGTIDNLVVFMQSLWLVDYKTMGRLDMRDFLKYEIDIQLTAYIYGGTKQLSLEAKKQGRPPVQIRGAIIDGLVKTQIPQFHREIFTRTIEDLREFELEFCMKAWEIAAKHAIINNDKNAYDGYTDKMWALGRAAGWKVTFPKNTQKCFQYGICSMRDLCVKDTEVRRMAYRQRGNDYVDLAALKHRATPESAEGTKPQDMKIGDGNEQS